MLHFIIGLLTGGTIGVVTMCFIVTSKNDDKDLNE